MKMNLMHVARVLCLTALVSVSVASTYADDRMAANAKTASGTITAVDAKQKVLKVQGWFLTKTFVLGDNCLLTMGDKKDVALGDFRSGQKVTVNYKDADGVLVAVQVIEERLSLTGEVTAMDQNTRTIIVRHSGKSRTFRLADNYNIILNGNARGTLNDVKLGQRVTVIYDTPSGQWTARQVEQKSAEYTGTLDAINLSNRTINAGKHLLGDKTFHVADNCVIVANGRIDGHLQDLRLGQNYELSYDTVNGVNVVNRVALVPTPEKTGATQQSANPRQSSPSY